MLSRAWMAEEKKKTHVFWGGGGGILFDTNQESQETKLVTPGADH